MKNIVLTTLFLAVALCLTAGIANVLVGDLNRGLVLVNLAGTTAIIVRLSLS